MKNKSPYAEELVRKLNKFDKYKNYINNFINNPTFLQVLIYSSVWFTLGLFLINTTIGGIIGDKYINTFVHLFGGVGAMSVGINIIRIIKPTKYEFEISDLSMDIKLIK